MSTSRKPKTHQHTSSPLTNCSAAFSPASNRESRVTFKVWSQTGFICGLFTSQNWVGAKLCPKGGREDEQKEKEEDEGGDEEVFQQISPWAAIAAWIEDIAQVTKSYFRLPSPKDAIVLI